MLLDNGRVRTLADEVGRQALRCIRCSACLNVCPVYARVGGHAYGSVYPGPIGAILTPQLKGVEGDAGSLPYASSLCGACGDVCPVKIEIPRLLTHLRAREVASRSRLDPENLTMKALFHTFSSRQRYERAQKLARTASRPLARGGAEAAREPAGAARAGPHDLLGARAAVRLDEVARAARARTRDLPRMVAPHPRARARPPLARPLHLHLTRISCKTQREWSRPRAAAPAAPARAPPATPGPTSFSASVRPSATPRRPTSRATTAPRTNGRVTRS